MKVAHFNTFPYGGAATAAKRLHRQLNRFEADIESQFFFHRNDKDLVVDDSFSEVEFAKPESTSIWSPVQRKLEQRRRRKIHRQFDFHLAHNDHQGEVFSMAELPDPTRLNWDDVRADILHLHWISFFLDYPSFFSSVPADVPVVWTLHDMNAFTGGCHYSSGCTRFQKGCGHCGQIRNSGGNDLSRHSFRVKERSLRHRQIHVVTPSRWMGELAQQSPVWPQSTSFHVIHLGFDLQVFRPVERQQALTNLGLNSDAVLIGFGAEDIRNQRKGFHHLLNALKKLKCESPVECVVFGSGEIPDDPELPKMHHMGYVSDPEIQRLIYSASDLVVVPSREDNQPQIGLEAMACGTPVVGFDAGGIPEYVRHGVTGYLAELGDESGLAHQIGLLVDDPQARAALGARARMVMEREFEIQTQSARYLDLYESILFMQQYRKRAS